MAWVHENQGLREKVTLRKDGGFLNTNELEPDSAVKKKKGPHTSFGPPKGSVLEGKWDPLFQGNVGRLLH